jgi:serine/threonine protein kinase
MEAPLAFLADTAALETVGCRLCSNHPLLCGVVDEVDEQTGGAPVSQLLDGRGQQDAHFLYVVLLGRGAFADVFLAQSVAHPRSFFAVKRTTKFIDKEPSSDREANLLLSLPPHPHVCRCLGRYEGPRFTQTVMELGDAGTLERYLADPVPWTAEGSWAPRDKRSPADIPPVPSFSEERLLVILAQLLSGLSHLHRHQIIHRDIKPANILLRSCSRGLEPQGPDVEAMLCDFGVSFGARPGTDATVGHEEERTVIGTRAFASPELLRHWGLASKTAYSAGSDVWSLGSIFYLYILRGHVRDGLAGRLADVVNVINGNFPLLADVATWTSANGAEKPSLHDLALAAETPQSVLGRLERLLYGNTFGDGHTASDGDFTTTFNMSSTGGGTAGSLLARCESICSVMTRVRSFSLALLRLVDSMIQATTAQRITASQAVDVCSRLSMPLSISRLLFGGATETPAGILFCASSTPRQVILRERDQETFALTVRRFCRCDGSLSDALILVSTSAPPRWSRDRDETLLVAFQQLLLCLFEATGADEFVHRLFPLALQEKGEVMVLASSRGASSLAEYAAASHCAQNPAIHILSIQALLSSLRRVIGWWNATLRQASVRSAFSQKWVREQHVVLSAADFVVERESSAPQLQVKLLPIASGFCIAEDETVTAVERALEFG